MDSNGYCAPHKCHLCQDLYLDFSLKEPWQILKPLHKSMQNWSTERQNNVPNWIMPLSIRTELRSTEKSTLSAKIKSSLRRIKQSGSKNVLNDQYREVLLQDDTLRAEAANALEKTRFFDITFRECADRAQRGCIFFARLIEGDMQRIPPMKLIPGDEDCILGACEKYNGLEFGVPRYEPYFWQGLEIGPVYSFLMLTHAENQAAAAISTRPVELDPGSQINLSMLKSMFQACRSHHANCKKRNPAFTPTKLLELYYENEKKMVRVVCTSLNKISDYAAISYCLGTGQHLTTIQGNLSQLMKGFSYEELPSTLRDVILIVEALEIQFVWIDSLCIIQENIHSKVAEMRTMSDIYENAAVTILASRAKDVNEGILKRREPAGSQFPVCVFEMQYNKNLTQPGSVVLVKDWDSSEPLDCRAWALQERLVSPCIIDIGSRQTRWICRTLLSEDYVDGWKKKREASQDAERSFYLYCELQQFWKGFSARNPIDVWHIVVQVYSFRQITNLCDRLPAIAAIAQQFSKLLGPNFLAGLWVSNLPYELLWELSRADLSTKPKEYVGPSWSWISIVQPVLYVPREMKTPLGYKSTCPPKDEDFEILGYDIQLKWTEFTFGEVSSASLVARGIRRKVLWIPESQYKRSRQLGTLFTEDRSSVLPAQFIVDFLADDHDTSYQDFSMAVELLLIAAEPDTEISRSNKVFKAISDTPTHIQESLKKAEATLLSATEGVPSILMAYSNPTAKRYFHLQGLVLRQLSAETYERLGVFEFRHFYSSDFVDYQSANGSRSWNDTFREYHRYTNWMIEGEVKTFTLV